MEKDKALDMALSQIEKQFGKGSIMRLGEKTNVGVESIPTGALALDLALGVGGLPRGRIVEIFGPESSGKSTLAMHVVAEAQRNGGQCAYVDAEHALDPVYATAIGVNTDELLISQPDTGEQALEITDMLIRSGALDVVVIDSVAALVPRAEIEGEMGDAHVGLQARLMSQALRKLTGSLSKTRTVAVFINQLREKIGVMFGSPETTPGGRALKFYSSVRLDIRRIETLKDGTEAIGSRARVKVVKNKCVAAGTTVFDPVTGLTRAVEEIVRERSATSVIATDKQGTMHIRSVEDFLEQGEREVIGLELRDGTVLRVTPDHKVLTDRGWKEAGELTVGDQLARPRIWNKWGNGKPYSEEEARLLGYLIGDGYVGGKTPMAFITTSDQLRDDVRKIVAKMGCNVHQRGLESFISHRVGEKNEVLNLARRASIWGKLAPDKSIPPEFFQPGIAPEIAANMVFGLLESDGYVCREQTGSVRIGYATTSKQLAHQVHWLLLRFGIWSSVRPYVTKNRRPSIVKGRRIQGKLPIWEVRVSGIDNVERFATYIPMWGPRGTVLRGLLTDPALAKHRGSQTNYLSSSVTEQVLAYLRGAGVTATLAAQMIGDLAGDPQGGLKQVLGVGRLRRDRMERLADALDSQFLRELLDEQLHYARIVHVYPEQWLPTYDIAVDEFHNFVADDVVVHNCSAPFRQAEFDIMYGQGISREGSLLDVATDLGIVKKSGAWFTYEGEQLGQGRENVKQFLAENLDVMVEIAEKVRKEVAPDTDAEASVDITKEETEAAEAE